MFLTLDLLPRSHVTLDKLPKFSEISSASFSLKWDNDTMYFIGLW